MLQKILIPLDGSDVAERALAPGLKLAQQSEAKVLLIRSIVPERMLVTDTYSLGGYAALWPSQSLELARTEAKAYLKTIGHQRVPPGLRVGTHVVEGDPAAAIVDFVRAEAADLIVMSSHGYSGVTRWVQGSVAERVLYASDCPVMVIRSADPIQHILIPLDGSSLAEAVLDVSFAVAEALQSKVTLLRAVKLFADSDLQGMNEIEPGLGRSFEEEMVASAQEYLNRIAARYQNQAPGIKTVVSRGAPAERILDHIDREAVDMVAISTHGHTGLRRWVYGSVTEKVLHTATRSSMLVVRPGENHLA